MPTGIETKKTSHEPFPLDSFLDQVQEHTGYSWHGEGIQFTELRSRKHATVEILHSWLDNDQETQMNESIIVKYFIPSEVHLMEREHVVLVHAAASGIEVPRILGVLDNFLVLERITGFTLMDAINGRGSMTEKTSIVEKTAAWLATFHDAFAVNDVANRRGDANLRNFIVTREGTITGIDFEGADTDDPIMDLHEIIDSILQSDPGIFSATLNEVAWKFDLCENLLGRYVELMQKNARVLFESSRRFVQGQERVMNQLARIRGREATLSLILPGLKQQLLIRLEHVFTKK
ncbi:MAG TPA: hypothetical protein VKM55_23690 [Candidatus Lokiarchaeia archaeon]|nr:hypothetical protein [Candidatus Lokiarchaeia archaeon]